MKKMIYGFNLMALIFALAFSSTVSAQGQLISIRQMHRPLQTVLKALELKH